MKKNVLLLMMFLGMFLFSSAQEFEIENLCDALPETVDVEINKAKPVSYMNVIITDGDWLNGSYQGWCIDTDNSIEVTVYNDAAVYCSYETLPEGLVEYPENLDLINWILNNVVVGQPSPYGGNYTYGDIQRAIWALIDDTDPPDSWISYIQPFDPGRVTEIMENTNVYGEGYEPGLGDYLGVIVDPGANIQVVILAVPIIYTYNVDCAECEGQITSLDLEFLGDEIDATVKIYEGKVKTDKLFKTFTNVNYGDILSFTGSKKNGKMGAKIYLTINDEDGNKIQIHTSCSQDIYVGMEYGGKYLITAGESHEGGPLCEYTPTGDGDCAECEGQITSLDLEFLGDEIDATVKIYEGKVKTDKLFKTFTNVNYGDILSFTGSKKNGKMGAKIYLTINDEDGNKIQIHTSCSQDIYVGMEYGGKYLITAGESHEGGSLCVDPNKSANANVNTEIESFNLMVYPNPILQYGTIEFVAVEDANATVEVYNLVGTRVDVLFNGYVESNSKKSLSLDVSKYPKGMYIIYIKNGSSFYKEKLSIIK